jgi:hypothetical protein
MSMSNKPVLVTTAHRGVFFGLLESRDGNSVILVDARCAIRWSTTGGFLELAQVGPNKNSKIGATAPRIELFDVTSISDVTEEAAQKWQAA